MADELTLNDYLTDLRLNLSRLEGIVTEVEELIEQSDLDAAAMVLGSQTGKIGRFTESYGALQEKLRDEGADRERALKRT